MLLLIMATVAALVALAADLFTPDQDPTGILNMIGPVLFGVIIPFIVARWTKEGAEAWVKFATSAGLAVVVAAVTAYQMDWTDVTTSIPALLQRTMIIIAGAQTTYIAVDKYMNRTGVDLNDHPAARPEKGIG